MNTARLSLITLFGLAACESAPPQYDAAEAPEAKGAGAEVLPDEPLVPEELSDPERAIESIHSGDYAHAGAILNELRARELELAARALMAEGNPRDALLPLDDALDLLPESSALWFLRGQAAMATAPSDSQAGFFYEDARRNFEESAKRGGGARALLEASRAARLVPDAKRALAYARAGVAKLAGGPAPAELDVAPERILVEASFDVYVQKLGAEEDTAEYYAEIEDQLLRLMGREADNPWVWTQLANIYQYEGQGDEAIRMLEGALDLTPGDLALHERMWTLVPTVRDYPGLLDAYARFEERHPELPIAAWYTARTTYQIAVTDFLAGKDSRPGFQRAEELFQRCSKLEPEYADSCLNYEIMCRNGVGRCFLLKGEFEEARLAFLSMEELKEGGLRWEDEALYSGVRGLEWVASTLAQDSRQPKNAEQAAQIYDFLHAYDPTAANFANNAGFFNREAAMSAKDASDRAAHAATTESDEAKKAALLAEAAAAEILAVALVEKSYSAYLKASELAPEDVRIINDTALIMTYYLRTDPDTAEAQLVHSVEMGAEQLDSTTLEGQDLVDLTEAWGDAHQNLGVLYLTLRDDPATARGWFEKSVEIGPHPQIPRTMVSELYLPACDAAIAGEAGALDQVRRAVWFDRRP
jgi:tetratricopeptide (TPR) repeat protein